MFAPTLNSRTIRSVMISRCSSPIPRMIVWPVSRSVWTLKVGSSCISFESARPIFSWSAFVLGSMATAMTGSGKFMASRMTGAFSSQIVSHAHGGGDVAGPDFLDLLALVRMHLQDAADPFGLVAGRVVNGGPGIQVAGVDTEEGELPDERVGHDL